MTERIWPRPSTAWTLVLRRSANSVSSGKWDLRVPKVMTKITPSLANPGDTHCSSCQVIVAKNVDTSDSDSAKIRKIIELVNGIEQRSNKTEKIIIFSQFTTMLRLIQEVLNERGLKFVQCKPPFLTRDGPR